jgi:hypothetical protein
MATSGNAKLYVELSQTAVATGAMTDSGDHIVFTRTGANVISKKSGYTATIMPDGIITGRNLLTPDTGNNEVNHAAFTAYSTGVKKTVDASSSPLTITRPATNVAKVNSMVMDSDGVVSFVAGTDGSTSSFSETRGAAGGPPYIAVGSVEIGQVRVTSSSDAVIATDEIYQVDGTHVERYDYPMWNELNTLGDGLDADASAKTNAYLEFQAALPLIHTGDVSKGVYISCYTADFSEVALSKDFKPAQTTYSSSSEEWYDGVITSSTSSQSDGEVTIRTTDNITDSVIRLGGEVVTYKFKPDKNQAPYILTQGKTGVDRTFPISEQNNAVLTITEAKSVDFSS